MARLYEDLIETSIAHELVRWDDFGGMSDPRGRGRPARGSSPRTALTSRLDQPAWT